MNSVWEYLDQPSFRVIGWTILHSLWQGAAIGIAFAFARLLLRQSARARYLAGCVALAAMLGAAALTFARVSDGPEGIKDRSEGAAAPSYFMQASPAGFGSAVEGRPADYLSPATPVLTVVWLLGVSVLSARLAKNAWWVRGLRARQSEPLDEKVVQTVKGLCRRLDISRPVKAMKSTLVRVPTVVGWLKPVILVPASTLSGLSPAQLEAILVHELAHVKRHDYLVNTGQCVLETLMFYHPVVWWISRCVREERENCCDDLVVKVCGDRLSYAKALASLEASRGGFHEFAFAAAGGSLLNRVRRLMGLPEISGASVTRRATGFAFVGVGLLLLVSGIFQFGQKPQYVSSTRIKLQQEPMLDLSGKDGGLSLKLYDPYFLQTEMQVLQSPAVMEKAAEKLKASENWTRKHGPGTVSTGELASQLARHLTVRPIANTPYLEILAMDDDPQDAADLANAVTSAYTELRKDRRKFTVQGGLNSLRDQMDGQEKRISTQQTVVNDLREKLKVPDSIAYGDQPAPLITTETLRRLESLRIETQAQYVKDRALYNDLKSLSPDKLEQVLPTVTADTLLTSLLEQRSFAEQKLVQLKKDYGPQHPECVKTFELIDDLNKKITTRVDGIMIGLTQKAESQKKALDQIVAEIEDAKAKDISTASRFRPYFEAKQKLEELKRFNQVMQMKYTTENIEASMPKGSLVEVLDDARPALRPSLPNRPRASVMMVMGAVLALAGLLITRGPRTPELVAQAA